MDDFAAAGRYLRGELDERELASFEERLLVEDALAQVTAAAEEELLDAYAAGALDAAARARISARLAVDPELRAQLAVSRGFAARAARAESAHSAAPTRRRRRWLAVPVLAAVAAAAIALIALRAEPAAVPAVPEVVELALAAPTRASLVPEVRIPDGARTLRLWLDCACGPAARAALRGPAGAVPVQAAPASEGGLVVEVAARSLAPGLHELIVTEGGATTARYELRIRGSL